MKILVVGAGSIGARHLRNLNSIGIEHLSVCEKDQNRLFNISEGFPVKTFFNFKEALDIINPDAVFICTPPVFHIEQAMLAIEAGAHLFIEKPLSHSLEGVDELIEKARKYKRIVQVGYNLRFDPGLQRVKELVGSNVIGDILWARAEFGQYLPDWRPWQDYRLSYTAQRKLGGGIILDASHELDYILWLLGRPIKAMCMAGKVSRLRVDVEDCATFLIRFENGAQADIHMDFVQREYTRSCKLVGEKGTVIWDYPNQKVKIYTKELDSWETMKFESESNDMYIKEVQHFLACVENKATPLVDLEQAKFILNLVMDAKSEDITVGGD